ncbi:MAG: alanine--tRNA ligase, partial [Gemmatimonadetes bacterium]|nr:alanine--tRNA ligase [Gemmatimonadota bacterium]
WAMGETGPCGPCSELHYYLGDDLHLQSEELFRQDGPEFVEIGNLVFIQFNRDETGALQPLPSQHVDTGTGFERLCSLLQDKTNNYDTDVFRPLIERIADVTARDPDSDTGRVPMRVIADHVRALTFAIADGAMPANDGRGYVLRRILRRAARFGRQLDQHEPFIHRLVGPLLDTVAHVFPEAAAKAAHVAMVIKAEEESFGHTLDRGLDIFARLSAKGDISGSDAFLLYDTYGFPLDLTELMARERNLTVDTVGFERQLDNQRQRGRAATKGRFRATEGVGDAVDGDHSRFIGYDELEADTITAHAETVEDRVRIVLEMTPFYAESGGQVGDRGMLQGDGFRIEIDDTVRARGGIVHEGRLVEGELPEVGAALHAAVHAESRVAAARNHTATHLLHEALRLTLGDHVDQMGSLVSADRLRFDFSHFQGVEPGQLRQVEQIVNERIRDDLEVSTFEEGLDRAKELGARALFGEKYGDRVRVVKIDSFSLELCGGTHVQHTGQIGFFDLSMESGIAAGTRRVEALAGAGAEQAAQAHRQWLGEIGQLLNAPAATLPEQVKILQQRTRELEKALAEAHRRAAGDSAADLTTGAFDIDGVHVVASRVQVDNIQALRSMADGIREGLPSGVGVLGADVAGKVSFIAVVTEDLIKERGIKAGDIIKEVAQIAGGSGGGKPHMAQAGGQDPGKIDE